MTVYVVTEETNGTMGGEPDQVVVGVFATEALANADVATREAKARADGQTVWGDDDETDEWDVDFHVEPWPVTGAPS
jgi:hypothetical protein